MEFRTVRIVKSLESDRIVGADGRVYRVGKGMVVTLPKLNAEVLVSRGAARPVEMDEADLFLEEAVL